MLSETGEVQWETAGLHPGADQGMPWRCKKASLRVEEENKMNDAIRR
jgi:hypothetical protein